MEHADHALGCFLKLAMVKSVFVFAFNNNNNTDTTNMQMDCVLK